MAGESDAFEIACEVILSRTSLTGPQVRGSVRLALKEGGLRAKTVSTRQLLAVVERLMPERLVAQGLESDDARRVCDAVSTRLEAYTDPVQDIGPGSMLDRLDRAREKG